MGLLLVLNSLGRSAESDLVIGSVRAMSFQSAHLDSRQAVFDGEAILSS